MSGFYDIFFRTAESVWKVKTILAEILNCPLKKRRENLEIFYATLLGVTIELSDKDLDDDRLVVQYKDEVIPLSRYDLRVSVHYERSAFIRNYSEEWEKFVSVVIADMLCNRLNCESIVIRNYETVIERFIFMERYNTPRNEDD